MKNKNVQKIELVNLLSALNILGNKKIKILIWLLQNKDYENRVISTIIKICEETRTSKKTVIETLRQLEEVGVLEKIQNGVFLVNLGGDEELSRTTIVARRVYP